MFKNFFILYFRNLQRNRTFSWVNIAGLTLGLTCFTLIILYLEHELSFDRFHREPESIHRVVKDFVSPDGTRIPDATTPPALARAIREELPEVQHVTRLFPNWGRLYLLQHGEKRFYETKLIRIDEYFFKVFDFPFIAGSKEKPFNGVHDVILTESLAKKYFGNEDPIGKVIRMNLNNGTDYIVSAVLKDIPQNSHFTFDILIPFESRRNPDTEWDWSSFYTYVRLQPGTKSAAFESHVQDLFRKRQPNSLNEFHTQAITDIHLKSRLKWELAANSDILYVQILFIIAIFTLLIAGINYINLVTAQASKRAKEVGIKKVTGSARGVLIRQFLFESVATAVVSLILSVIFSTLALPIAQDITGYDLSAYVAHSTYTKFLAPIAALAIGILAGLYPAFYLSSFEPLKVLRGSFLHSRHGIRLRQGLVIFQFIVSTGLIIAALTIAVQLNFMQEKKLGFNQNHVLLLPNVRGGIGNSPNKPEDKLAALKKIPGVARIARADGVLGSNNSTNGVSAKNGNHISLNFIRADYEFLPTLEIELAEGRNFSEQFVSDSSAIILNEMAIVQLGLTPPFVGQQLAWDDENGVTNPVTLIGIVKDFHFTSLREAIKPFGFILEVGNGSTFFLKLDSRDLPNTLAQIEKTWNKFSPDFPFEYTFQDDLTAKLHLAEARFQKLFSWFTIVAVIIACLGVFGLITYLAEAKTKEIGIRKVMGASAQNIVLILSGELMTIVFVAFVIASPLAWYVMQVWLQNFAYQADLSWQVFAAAGLSSVVITLFTVGFQTIKAALANPIHSLRNE